MKIDNSRIFTADIYEVADSTVTKQFKEDLNHGTVFGSYSYGDRQTHQGVVVVSFGKDCYVPVWYLRNIIDYVDIKLHTPATSKKFLHSKPGFAPMDGEKFLKNIEPLFSTPGGKTSLSELSGIQKIQHDRDKTYSGGMQIM